MPRWLQRADGGRGKQQSSGKIPKLLLAVKDIAVTLFSVWMNVQWNGLEPMADYLWSSPPPRDLPNLPSCLGRVIWLSMTAIADTL